VEETTSTFPVTESPFWNRITAGVYSVGWIRGARQADDAGGHVICLTVSIDLNLHCIADYERVWEGEVTARLAKRKKAKCNFNTLARFRTCACSEPQMENLR
jgi:hypothetical protein